MKYKIKDIEEMNRVYRESLRPSWQELEMNQTDKGKGLPKPSCVKEYASGEIFELNKDLSSISSKTLYEVVMSRRSVRKYKDEPMTKDELSYLCNATSSIMKFGPGYAMGVIPTGGATNTLETYLYLNRVEGFKKGLYHYMKDTGNLRLIREDVSNDMVNQSIAGQLRNAAVIYYWTTTPYRSEYKYQFVSHKMIGMEAGHACQNLYLSAEAIDHGVVAIAAYNQELADKLLQVGGNEFVIYAAAVGKKL
ncbi:SagB/ThcOx family dehydrogenase [Mycoplasmatota bacterium WC30]